ncbi:MAG: hypothetical protein WB973_19435 [Thermoanaerobaculia bacterium]
MDPAIVDRGATWNPPLYTGLRVMQPYEVVIGSTLPMLRDDGVQLNDKNYGATYLLEKRDGVCKALLVGSWVS